MLVTSNPDLSAVVTAVEETGLVAIDSETTGLDWQEDRVRLLTLGVETTGGRRFAYLVDCFAIDPAPLLDALKNKDLVLHNAAFDLGFLRRLGFVPGGEVYDTLTMSRVLHAGSDYSVKHDLAALAKRELGIDLDKGQQKSNWSGKLTSEQRRYAAADVLHLAAIRDSLAKKLADVSLDRTEEIERRCLPAVAWMSSVGVAVDGAAWLALAEKAEADAARLKAEMAALAPVRPGEFFATWKWDSPADMLTMFRALGFCLDDTNDASLARIDHPIAGLLREYREAVKKTGTYGRGWLKHVRQDGHVYPTWKQNGSEAGRMSCESPNMQQIPREAAYRRCVVAPPGRVLVKADYSQIELRIAAKVSGDKALLDAYAAGVDVHTQTAQRVLGKKDVTKQDRQLAKALNFGLIYGMGVKSFCAKAKTDYGIELTEEQAREYRASFFRAYPGLERWHRSVRRAKATETRTLAGRRRLVPEPKPGLAPDKLRSIEAFQDRVRLNTPVQGTGADGLKLALALLWERRDETPGAFPVLAVHDEIVVECDMDQAEAVARWVKQAMLDGIAPLVRPVPVEVEVQVAPTWDVE
jgi:DNA polymerase-1